MTDISLREVDDHKTCLHLTVFGRNKPIILQVSHCTLTIFHMNSLVDMSIHILNTGIIIYNDISDNYNIFHNRHLHNKLKKLGSQKSAGC